MKNTNPKNPKKRMYIRVSKTNQNTDRQHEIAKFYNVDEIYEEKISSFANKRPQFDKMMNELKNGDTVIVESLSRLFRSTKHLLDMIDYFNANNIELISDKEKIDTTSASGKLMFTIFSALAQFERELLIERTQEGLRAAKEKGVKLGRKKTDETIIQSAMDLHNIVDDNGNRKYTVNAICDKLKISRATFYREKKIYDEKVL